MNKGAGTYEGMIISPLDTLHTPETSLSPSPRVLELCAYRYLHACIRT